MHIDSDSALCSYPVIILSVFLTNKICVDLREKKQSELFLFVCAQLNNLFV